MNEQKKGSLEWDLNKNIEKLEHDNSVLKAQLEEAIERAANSLNSESSLESERKSLVHQIENLKNSKKLLQRTLSEQLSSLKGQLENLKDEKIKCDDAIRLVSIENERLQKLCENEQKRN
eukprot:CAMPEP_0116913658 /NCGR_PEP_ID=MMETSP0467-20121206/16833_1 /TAXON_ID=283647 /ORGANISM="Mesodinium pulex, Strain SPMC105" /LENGTH=119 /DNA_ID=CAMNT_0004589911 /DNA_START=1211 /DNA_END=1570 /DNA_ORIENTATION=+